MLNDILQEEQYQIIRYFINGLMSRNKPAKEISKQYGNLIDQLGDDLLLHKVALEGNANIIEFMLESVREAGHKDSAIRLLTGKEYSGETVWHKAANKGELNVLQKITDSAKDILTKEQITNILLLPTKTGKHWFISDDNGYTAWQLAALSGKVEVLKEIWSLAKDNLTTEDIKNKLLLATNSERYTAWHLAALSGKVDVLQEISNLAKEILTGEDIKNKLLLATVSEENILQSEGSGYTAWHLAARMGNVDVIKEIWNLAKENLSRERINKLLLDTTRKKENMVL
jgi:ankyrin repeat protein